MVAAGTDLLERGLGRHQGPGAEAVAGSRGRENLSQGTNHERILRRTITTPDTEQAALRLLDDARCRRRGEGLFCVVQKAARPRANL
jgi:hypothetical protein